MNKYYKNICKSLSVLLLIKYCRTKFLFLGLRIWKIFIIAHFRNILLLLICFKSECKFCSFTESISWTPQNSRPLALYSSQCTVQYSLHSKKTELDYQNMDEQKYHTFQHNIIKCLPNVEQVPPSKAISFLRYFCSV